MGGKKDFRIMWREYYKSCHALIYVVDASEPDINRLEESKQEFDSLIREKDLRGVPFLIMANYKSSLVLGPLTPTEPNLIDNERYPIVGTEQEQQIFRKIFIDTLDQGIDKNCIYFVKSISALTGAGVQESIQLLVDYLRGHARHVSDEDFI